MFPRGGIRIGSFAGIPFGADQAAATHRANPRDDVAGLPELRPLGIVSITARGRRRWST